MWAVVHSSVCVQRHIDLDLWCDLKKKNTEELLSLHFMEHEQNFYLFIRFIKYSKNSNIVKYNYNLK